MSLTKTEIKIIIKQRFYSPQIHRPKNFFSGELYKVYGTDEEGERVVIGTGITESEAWNNALEEIIN